MLEDQAVGPGAGEVAGVPVGKKSPVVVAVEPDRGGVAVVDRPTDVVVTAQIGDPGAGGRGRRQRGERRAGKHGASGGEHRPDLDHQAVVIGQIADPAGVLAETQVLHEVARPDNRLGLEGERGRRDPGNSPQHLGDRMHLRLVLAVGAQPFPHEGDRVQADHLDTVVGQEQDDLRELHQHLGVGPVEVPLPPVERGPDPTPGFVVPGEAARSEIREHLGHGRLVGVGKRTVRMDVEVVAVRRLPRPGPDCPLVLAGHVVEDQVDNQADPSSTQPPGEFLQILGGTEVWADRAVVADGVPAVVVAVARLQQRHQVQVADAEVLQVADLLADTTQVAGEPLGVAGVPEHSRTLQPVRGQQPPLVQSVQLGLALGIGRGGSSHQSEPDLIRLGVEHREPGHQVLPPRVQPKTERLTPLGGQPSQPRHDRLVHLVGGDHLRIQAQTQRWRTLPHQPREASTRLPTRSLISENSHRRNARKSRRQ